MTAVPRQPDSRSGMGPDQPTDADDRALVARVQAGETDAWRELVERYQRRLFGVCMRVLGDRELAADCCQDAFLKLIKGIGAYDGRAKFSTWAIRVTMNVCISKLRSEKLRRHAPLEGSDGQKMEPEAARGVSQPSDALVGGEARRRVALALATLPEDQRGILLMRDVQGLGYEALASTLGVAVGTVKSRLFRARKALREAMSSLSGDSAL